MSEHEHWQLVGSAPELYQRYIVPAITSVWAADLMDRVRPSAGQSVLDVACGTGVVARLAAERMGTGRVVGVDYNSGMLAVARSVSRGEPAIDWIEGSALSLPFAEGTFDHVICQLGLQFFPDRPLAVGEMKRVLVPEGQLTLSVYSAIERTPAAWAFSEALDRELGAGASRIKRAEHVFTDPDELAGLLSDQGFDNITIAAVTKQITFPSLLDYVRFQLIATPMARLLEALADGDREAVIERITSVTAAGLDAEMLAGGRLRFPQEAFVAVANNSVHR
ncbi:MAG TPA: methyltransferase domain-containing protein [Hyphomicrobiaceae bacterium]|nr:methyltransferase domain-containing protein [Hyphomicrobiaceae bacterium]